MAAMSQVMLDEKTRLRNTTVAKIVAARGSLDDPETKKVSTILGGKAQPRTKLNRPHGVAISPDGALWVCDSWNDRVVVLRNY